MTSATAFSGRLMRTPHSRTPAPQVKPAPTAASSTRLAGAQAAVLAQQAAASSGIDAADVLPISRDVVGDALGGLELELLADGAEDAAVGLVVDEEVDVVEPRGRRARRPRGRLGERA